jgi:hypothetical protein
VALRLRRPRELRGHRPAGAPTPETEAIVVALDDHREAAPALVAAPALGRA